MKAETCWVWPRSCHQRMTFMTCTQISRNAYHATRQIVVKDGEVRISIWNDWFRFMVSVTVILPLSHVSGSSHSRGSQPQPCMSQINFCMCQVQILRRPGMWQNHTLNVPLFRALREQSAQFQHTLLKTGIKTPKNEYFKACLHKTSEKWESE